MKKLTFSALAKNKATSLLLASVATIGFATPAAAVDFITITGPSGVYGNPSVTCVTPAPCNFTSNFMFNTPAGFRLVGATITSVHTGTTGATNIDFTSVTLNGVAFSILSTGVVEFRNLLNQNIVSGGGNTISVNGLTGGEASFSGTLSFAAVPEPATWAMMIVGFGLIGGALRSAKGRQTTRVRFA